MAQPQVICPACGEKVPANFEQCWKCQGDVSSAVAVGLPRPETADRCTHCHGTDLEKGIRLSGGASHGVGLLFAGGSFASDLAGGSLEALRLDLCRGCGTVVRWWVAQPDRLWMKRG